MRRTRTPPRFAPRPKDAHKASVGKVLVVGGSRGMRGAPALAGLGALRAGAGLVSIAVPRSIQGTVATMRPEATTADLAESPSGGLALRALSAIAALREAWDVLVFGPGIGRAAATLRLARAIARSVAGPLVLDADALFALDDQPEQLRDGEATCVLTPHEGEAGRLLGVPSAEVRGDREAAAIELAEKSGTIVVLKGPGTIVTDGARLFVCTKGGPHLASGGTGDVLAGVVGAFLAGLPATGSHPFGAACAAVHVHALAGDAVAAGRDRGLLASDVAHALPDAVATLIGKRQGKRS